MKTHTFRRLIKTGLTNFFRNIWLSIAATSVKTVTLFIISTILVLYVLSAISLANLKDKVGITAYFNNTTSETEILNIKDELSQVSGIKEIVYIPKNLARDKFIAAHQDDPLLIQTINEFTDAENPLPASFSIKANDLTDYNNIAQVLNSDRYKPYFAKIRDNNKVITRLKNITDTLTKAGIGLAIIFIIITMLVMFNTIRLTLYNRREEIEIMRLVGATNWYIRAPFIIEGMLYGFLAAIISSGVTLGLFYGFAAKIANALGMGRGQLLGLMNLHVWEIIGINFVVGIGLGIVSSTIAIRRYLKI